MTSKMLFASLMCGAASVVSAAGIDWSYSGGTYYQKALVVWSDEDLGFVGIAQPKEAVTAARNEILERLNGADPVLWTDLPPIGAKSRGTTYVKADDVDPNAGVTRLKHEIIYARVRTGWGFSLLANLDAEGRVVEYALNEVTSGDILSEINGKTSLTITEDVLTEHVTPFAGERLKAAGAPAIAAHVEKSQTRALEDPSVFRFDITNAVSGFTYKLVEADDPRGPFLPSTQASRLAEADGRLDFAIVPDPEVKVRFYKVSVKEFLREPN